MDRAAFRFAVFAAFTLVVFGEDDSSLCKRTTKNQELLLCSPNNTYELILIPDNTGRPCVSEIMVCGIKSCENKSLPQEIHHSSQSSVTGNNTKELSGEEEQCNCFSNNTHFFIEQEMMSNTKHHFVKCRMKEDSKTGCKGVICDWKLINITEASDDYNESLDATDCMCRNTCLAVCQRKTHVRWQDSKIDLLSAIGIMAFVSVTSLVFCYLLDRCMNREKPRPYVEATEMQTVPPQSVGQQPSTSTECRQQPSTSTECRQQPSTYAACNDNYQEDISETKENEPVVKESESGDCKIFVNNAYKEDDIDDTVIEAIFQ